MLYKNIMQPDDVLRAAYDDIVAIASEVGIDGHQVLQALPAPGQLITGIQVPVLHKRYQNNCYVLLHINQTRSGMQWPFLQFHTFKDGGKVRTFNGFQWLRHHEGQAYLQRTVNFRAADHKSNTHEEIDNTRLVRHNKLMQYYNHSAPIHPEHPWLIQRFRGHANAELIARTDIRLCNQRILARLKNARHQHTGFHSVQVSSYSNAKRHYIRQAGLLKGSSVRINASQNHVSKHSSPTMICEGLATGLSLALVWPGEIRIALFADNLSAVRNQIDSPAIFCCDNDQWKPHLGNVGLSKAKNAMQYGDNIRIPNFLTRTLSRKPTDFNDLLMYEGLSQLSSQISMGFDNLG